MWTVSYTHLDVYKRQVLDEHPVSIQVNGEWQTFPNVKAAEEASYEEYKANLRRTAENFRITCLLYTSRRV